MTAPPTPAVPQQPRVPALDAAAGVFAGFALLAAVNAAAIAIAVPLPVAGLGLGAAHLVFDAAETLAVGAVAAAAIGAFLRYVRLPTWGMYGAGFVAAVVMVYVVIGAYLGLQAAHALGGNLTKFIFVNDFLLLGGAFVVGPAFAWRLALGPARRRLVPTAAGAALMVGNQFPLRDDYFGIHCLIAVGAALVAGPPLAAPLLRVVRRMARGTAGRASLGAIGLFTIAGLVIPPGNEVRQQLFRQPSAVGPWVLATALWRSPEPHTPVTVPRSWWLRDRSHDPAIPPTTPRPLPDNPVIVLITIDALRAEALYDPEHAPLIPTFTSMMKDGVVFTHATTPGAQTPTSLAAVFSGRYFSEQKWEDYGEGGDRFPYPANDPSPRFPELLAAHGVTTIQNAAFVFLVNRFGAVRGFQEEKMLGHTRNACPARFVISPLIDRLKRANDEPLFLYTHIGEPHGPYVYGRPGDPVRTRYLAAVTEADTQVGRVLHELKDHFDRRWVLIVSADHGEAFGEHQTTDHSKTLYEELLHVPLLVEGPAFAPRKVDERVGLVDLGPTILDLFGVDTPATFNGQSLAPILTGGSVHFTRPLLAEGRLAKEYTTADGLKVIDDPRKKVVEVYDLEKDPGELVNLFDAEPDRADAALAFLRAFYAVHAYREGGYEPPYKP